MSVSKKANPGRQWPIFQGILPIDRARISTDIIAGISLAAMAIPAGMGYTKIAGMPVITGLYTLLIPMALFAIFGSSRHLVVGADSATAAIMAAGLAGMATTESTEYVALVGVLAFITAIFLILARVVKLGFLADFLSRTVLIGFLTGVGVQVAVGQISGMLGIPGGGSGPILQLLTDFQQLSQTNTKTLAVSVGVLVIIFGAGRINKKIPGALIAVIGAIIASYVFDLSADGVAILGDIPSGLPKFSLPNAGIDWSTFEQLVPTAFSLFVVILAQSAATSRAYAARYSERFSENVDLVGLGLANIGSSLTGTFVVNGSPTKTQMVDGAGGRSQLAMLTTSLIVVLVLLFLTVPLGYMPSAVLSAVVFVVGVQLVDLKGMRNIYDERPGEFWVALITTLTVIFIGVEEGILLAMFLSLALHVKNGYRPKNSVLTQSDGHWTSAPISAPQEALPGLMIYRFSHSMYYANAGLLGEEILSLTAAGTEPVSWLCIDMNSVDDVDFSAAAVLREGYKELKDRGVRLVLTDVSDDLRAELDRSQVSELIGNEYFFAHLEDLLDAFQKQAP